MEHFQIKWGQGYLFGGHSYFIERIHTNSMSHFSLA
jgi:hypothetical protein